jgi:hypothetical protein
MVLTSRYNFVFLSFFSPLLMWPGLERFFLFETESKVLPRAKWEKKGTVLFPYPWKGRETHCESQHRPCSPSPHFAPVRRLGRASPTTWAVSCLPAPTRKGSGSGRVPRGRAPRSLRRPPSGQRLPTSKAPTGRRGARPRSLGRSPRPEKGTPAVWMVRRRTRRGAATTRKVSTARNALAPPIRVGVWICSPLHIVGRTLHFSCGVIVSGLFDT